MSESRELDAQIEERVFGSEISECRRFYCPPLNYPIPSYSLDMSFAWKVVETLNAHDRWIKIGPAIHKSFWVAEWGEACNEVSADSAPKAICLAALKYLDAIESEGQGS